MHEVEGYYTVNITIAFCFVSFIAGPPGNPEIWWASISEGSAEGGDELGLIGKKFQSGKPLLCSLLKNLLFILWCSSSPTCGW